MTPAPVRALIADDEPLLRERLRDLLRQAWPELEVVAEARNGREAVEAFAAHAPQVLFLDVHMPGVNGVEAARQIGGAALLVFVTAHEQYAVAAFEQGAIDYLVKPFDAVRLAATVQRLRARLAAPLAPPAGLDAVLEALAQRLAPAPASAHLQWITASVGAAVKLIPVAQVIYLRADEKYTLVVWEGGEALIRKTIRELAESLDAAQFVQIHRAVIVNLNQVAQVLRAANDTAEVQLKGRSELLPVSRGYLHLFRQM